MEQDFSDHFWTWYATDERRRLLVVCELIKALEFLQAPAETQSSQIPYCPACETWSMMMLPIASFLEEFPPDLSPSLREALAAVWLACNELPEESFRCDNFQMFHLEGWDVLRSVASKALHELDWENLELHVDEVISELRQKLFNKQG